MSLLTDLRTVAATALSGSELPTHVEVQDLLGALVKTVEAAGITVSSDLLPAPAAAVVDSAIEAAAPIADSELHKLLAYVKELEGKLEHHTTPPPATVTPGGSTTASVFTPVTGGPVAPPIEGAQ